MALTDKERIVLEKQVQAAITRQQAWERRSGVKTELTDCGEQYVIPGCEKHERPAGSQLKLWEA